MLQSVSRVALLTFSVALEHPMMMTLLVRLQILGDGAYHRSTPAEPSTLLVRSLMTTFWGRRTEGQNPALLDCSMSPHRCCRPTAMVDGNRWLPPRQPFPPRNLHLQGEQVGEDPHYNNTSNSRTYLMRLRWPVPRRLLRDTLLLRRVLACPAADYLLLLFRRALIPVQGHRHFEEALDLGLHACVRRCKACHHSFSRSLYTPYFHIRSRI
jgi:hypothetical protein